MGAATPAADGHDPGLILAALGRVAGSIAAEPASSGSDVAAPNAPVMRGAVPTDSVVSGGLLPSGADPRVTPTPAPAPAAAAAARLPSDTSAAPATGSPRRRARREMIATIIVMLCLVAILLALFA